MSYRKIFLLWWPLAASSILMNLELPFINAGIARTPDPKAALAGFGIAFSLAIFTEAPILMLIGTTAALAKDRPAFKLIERFTIQLGFFVTALHALLAFTPLYDVVVRDWMGVPAAVADAALPAFRILMLWPAPIGWRRFHQGLLVRLRRTSAISVVTMVRVIITALVTFAAIFGWQWPGQYAGATAVVLAVLVESTLITLVTRPLAETLPSESVAPLAYRQLFNFHTPLVIMSALGMLVQPLVSTALARAAFPTESLAGWPNVWGLVMLFGSLCNSLQETTIAMADSPASLATMRRFGLGVGLGASLLVMLAALTPLGDFYFGSIIGLKSDLRPFTDPALLLMIAYPLLLSTEVMLRGLLIRQHRTTAVRLAMICYVGVLGLSLALGVSLGLGSGVQVAAVSYNLAMICEIGLLLWLVRPAMQELRQTVSVA